jgi:hypothetical protein
LLDTAIKFLIVAIFVIVGLQITFLAGCSGMFAIKLCANAPDKELVTVIKLKATEDYGTGDTCTKMYFIFSLLDSPSGPRLPHC